MALLTTIFALFLLWIAAALQGRTGSSLKANEGSLATCECPYYSVVSLIGRFYCFGWYFIAAVGK